MKTFLSKILLQSYILTVLKSYSPTVLKPYRLLLTLSPLLLVSLSAGAQYYDVSYPGKGYPVMLRYYDGEQFQRYVVPDIDEQPVVRVQGRDKTCDFDLSFIKKEGQISMPDLNEQILEYYEPGIPLEGDFPIDAKFSNDGTIFAVAYQHSDNVIFYSVATYEILANVQVVRQPISLTMCDEHVYVCCHQGQGVVAISLDDFSISEYIAVDGTPFQVGISPGEDTAYIACDSHSDGWMIAYDMNTNQTIYETHDPYFHSYGYMTGGVGRTMYFCTSFKLSPKGDQYVCADTGTYRPAIFNAASGLKETRINIGGYRGAGYSPTGDTLFLYSTIYNLLKMYRINTLDNEVIDSVTTIADIPGLVGYSDLAISHDGSKVLVNDHWNNRYCLFDFTTGICQLIPEGMLFIESPVFASFDGKYAICATLSRVQFIDFETGEVYNTYQTGVSTSLPLGVSPKSEMLIAGNMPVYQFLNITNETLYAINFKDIDEIMADTALICGEPPEADVPVCADLSSDGAKIFTANMLTNNFSVIDLDGQHTDTIISIPDMTGIKVVPGTENAIAYGDDSGKSRIISQTDYSILKELNTGQVSQVFVTSDGQTAYLVGYPASNRAKISKIKVDGSSSSILDYAEVYGNHYSYASGEYEISSSYAMSPDEQLLLISYNNPQVGPQVNIVSTETLDVLTAIDVPDYLIYGYAFTDDSQRAVVLTAEYYPQQLPIIYLDGVNSYVEHLFPINFGSFSADYNPVDGMFYVLARTGYILKVDPLTGNIAETLPTLMDENLKIIIDKHGIPMVLTATSMIYNQESYAMPGQTSHLAYNEEYDLFLSAVPGPEWICVFDPKMVGIQQFKPGNNKDISIFPNPATEQIFIKSSSEITRVKVCNMAGTEVFSGEFKDKNIEIPVNGLPHGLYVVDIYTKTGNFARKLLLTNPNP